jgi:hypothetical protein
MAMEHSCQSTDLLERVSQIANITFAAASLVLTYYVFVYQRQKDKHNNRLEWFKDLIIEPHKEAIHTFFAEFLDIASGLKNYQLTDILKSELINKIKYKSAAFRRDFIVLLGSVDPVLEKEILDEVDNLVDEITRITFDPNYNLSDDSEYDKNVEILIYNSRVKLLSRIFKYES